MFDDIIDEELGGSRRKRRRAKRKVRRAKRRVVRKRAPIRKRMVLRKKVSLRKPVARRKARVTKRKARRASPRRRRILKKVGKAFGGIVTGGVSLAAKRPRRTFRKPSKARVKVTRQMLKKVSPGVAAVVTGGAKLSLSKPVRKTLRRSVRKSDRRSFPSVRSLVNRPLTRRPVRKVFSAPKYTVQRKAEVMSTLADKLAKATLRKASSQANTPTDQYRVKILQRLGEIGIKLPKKNKTRMKMNRKIILICKPMLKGLRRRRGQILR